MSPLLEEIVMSKTMTHDQKKAAIAEAGIDVASELRIEAKEIAQLKALASGKSERLAAMEDLKTWLERETFSLERNDCSRFHRLIEAVSHGRVISTKPEEGKIPALFSVKPNIIVVEHDWAAAFGDEVKQGGNDFSLPYPETVFEMRFSGRTVILLCLQADGQTPVAVPFVECAGGYWHAPFDAAQQMRGFNEPWWQVKAICVALDAEVATRTAIRAPHALNKKREKVGKLPLHDFHVVRLNRKPRTNIVAAQAGSDYTRKRLHFRRGHWRHYEGFKTWVRWALVGNPDLGFIDKEYRI